ncbi:hemagglutinin repeat-containing protein [Pseudomonas sp. ZB1P45]|uniref:two-partner secretion domain-containing protein n=1 Tax=Pseudomonas frigoris TaxID=3398356 RepID=UPI0039F0D80A
MDVRLYAFLARQPSAAVKTREYFWGMPKRGLAFLLANVMFWQPMWAQAEGIVVATPGTSLGQAGNGVPIIQIATPNGSGLSHNQFHDYNVGTQGVILNNVANQTGATQLGGIIVGNPNLTNRIAAQTILNEVIGGSPSQLRGYTEVAGQSARVIVANPYGISCNGCGFINTPRVTLTTGKPVLDNGRLDRFQVDQGSVSIDGAGLNANNVDSFEIITRSAKINAEIQAKNLTIVAGRNDVNAQTLNATARADDGSAKPQLAIDSSALGGMYAGAIKLVGTEAGVGVKLDGNLAASGGDIQLDANGHLSLAQTSATGAVNVKAASLDAQGPVYAGTAVNIQTQGNLTNQQTLAARDNITLSAGGQLTNNGIIEAGVNADGSRNANGDVSLSAQNLTNTGKSVIASRNLTVNTAQTLNNQGGTLSGQQKNSITATTLDNRNTGRVLGSGALELKATQVLNTQGVITSNGSLTANLGHLNNHDGEVSSAGNTTITATTLDNSDGQVTGDVALNIGLIGALNNQNGALGSGQSVSISAASLDNSHDGSLVSDGSFTARISGLFDNQNGDLSAKGVIDLQTGSLDNRNGNLTGKDRLTLRSDSLDNRTGKVRAGKDLLLTVGQLDNRQQGLLNSQAAINFNGTHLDNRGGLLSAAGPVQLEAASVDNSGGRISSKTDLTAKVAQFTNQGGELVAQGMLTLNGKGLDNRNGGLVGATKALKLNVDEVDNRGGEISSAVDVTIEGQSLNNSDNGKILAGTELGLKVAQIINQAKGLLFGKGATTVTGQSLDNSGGSLVAQLGLDIRLDSALSNIEGLISSEGMLTVNAASLDSIRGSLSSAGALALTTTGVLNNQGGSITTDSGLTLNSQSLNNSQNGLISGKNATTVTTGTFDNTQGGQLISGDTLDLTATQVSNGVASRIASDKALTASVTGFDQQGGQLFSKTALSLDLNQGQLNNQSGLINAPLLMLKNLKDVNNQNGEISSAQAFTLTAQNLDNSNGKLISNQALTLHIDQLLASIKGLISAQTLEVHSARLDNTGGMISSRGTLGVTVDGQLVNQDGTFIADGDVHVSADSLDNTRGQIAGKTDVTASVATLNNQGGQLIATGGLTLTGISLDNRFGGLVGATNALQLNVEVVDNRGGELSSKSDVTLVGNRLDNSDGGQVFAEGALALTVNQVINRAKGLLSGKADLTLTGRDLDNSGGSLLSQKTLSLDLTGDLNNSQGLLSAEGTLGVTAASLTNTLGSVSAAGPLTLTTTGAVLNQGGEIVTDAGITLNSASLDNRNKGSISGKGAVIVNTGALDNSHTGRLNSGASLDLTATQLTNQDGGRIASVGALTASVTGLDQQGGQLFSNTSLVLDLNKGQLNNQNGLISAPLLMLKNLTDINNDGGEISSAAAFTLTARSLDNSNGKLLSNQALTLRIDQALTNLKGLIAAAALDVKAASLNNSGGTLTSRANLDLNLDGLLNNQNLGLINATDGLTINSSGLNNQNGSLLGSAIAIDFGAATGDLNNSGGLITTAGLLSLQHLRDLNNRNGEISSSQSLNLTSRALDNSGGKLISNNLLTVNADTVLNQGGLISGWKGLSLTSNSLDNRNKGTLSSHDADVAVGVSGAILNSGEGALVSQKTLSVNAASLDNSNGGILSSGGAQTLTLSGLLNNAQGGLIDSGATLAMQAMTLGNAGGTVNAKQDLSFTGTTLDNTGGNLIGNAAVTLDLLGALTNTNGKLASAGPLRVQRTTHINNQGGQLASQGLMTLLTGGLDNRNLGTIAANDLLTITTGGTLQNSADGQIYSQNGDLQIQAASLANAKGTLQSQGALNLTIGGDIDNQSGRIVAKDGDLSIKAGNLDNRGGVLASLQAAFTANLTGVLKNGYDLNNNRRSGVTQAQRLNLTALAGIDNYGGRIAAQSGDAIIATGNFDNRNGGLYAKGKVNVTGNNFDNSGDNDGQIAGQQIDLNLSGALNNRLGIIESDSILSIKAASLDNQTGQLRALGTSGKTNFQIGGLFDNRNGTLESANTDLTMAVGGFLNGGGSLLHVGNGTFDISTANVTGAGGSIVTRGGLTLNADSWSNSNVIQAGRLNVNVNNFSQTASGQLLASTSLVGTGGNWYNDGLIASDGSLSLNLGGTYSGNGRVSSLGTLGLSVAQLNLNAASSIAGGGDTTVSVGGQLNNAGRLTSAANLTVNAGGIYNQGTLGSGQALTVTTGSLVNDRGLIFSGGNMSLRVNALNNSYANIYSLGNLTIDRNGQGAQADSIVNSSASIQSDGSMSLAASTIQNIRALLTISNGGIYTARIDEGACNRPHYHNDCGGGTVTHTWDITQREKLEVTAASAASSITAGGNLNINGGDLFNQSSTIATSGNLTATLNNLTNTGVETNDTETVRAYRSKREDDASSWLDAASAFTNQYWFASSGYDANHLTGLEAAMADFIGTTEVEMPEFRQVTQLATGDQSYAAIIQAAGAVNINAQNNIDNSVVRPGYSYVGSGPRTGTGASGSQFSTRITVNQQLPPNLAQQQVNPLTLPGFALPTGQNGLFRLSGQDSSTPVASAPQSWTMGGGSVTPTQRQQSLPSTQPRNILLGSNTQASASSVDLNPADHQASNVGVGASAIDVSTPTANSTGSALPGRSTAFTVNRVQGLPASSGQSKPQKYLIETNPVLTNLKQFMSSDYLLSNLGYDPDQSAKRLGDGLYEQRLIQQAVVARTGQSFIDGQTSDAALFKYLMNNAIASKTELNLSLGVSLTSEQVAALTHDIVWMENAEVNGEQVLVPVLYLANANNRLAANGALIQGSDVTLIAGKDLNNAGTLRASNNLSATATNDLVNSGLVEAGNRLDLQAGNNIVNKAGGIIAGRDVTLTATRGDVINERTVTTHESGSGYRNERTDFIDNAARIEAANNLTINAGRDINNVGGVLKSGADTTINAGRDVNLTSAEQVVSGERGLHRDQTITQYGSDVGVGQDLKVNAGRDITVIASQIDAKRDVSMSAVGDLTLASAADEQHSYSKSKKVTSQEDHVSQVSSSVNAGGSITLSAGKDLDLIASRVSAGDEAYLFAANNLTLQSAEDTDYSFYSKTKKSSSGKKSRLDEVASTTNIASAVTSGGNSTLLAGNDMLIKGSEIAADKGGVQLVAGNDVQIVAVTDSNSARHESSSSKSSWGGLKSSKVKDQLSETQTTAVGSVISGNTVNVVANRDATITGSSLVSTQDLTVQAGRDLTINAAENTFTRDEFHKEKNRDLSGVLTANNLGVDDITGNQHLSVSSQNHTGKSAQTTLTGSTIGSSEGNVSLTSGRELSVIASDLVSTKNMSLIGSKVTIAAGMESASQSSTDKSSSLAVGRVVGGVIVDTVNTIRSSVEAANNADDPRLKAVKLAQAAMAFNDLGGMGGDAEGAGSDYGKKQGSASNGSMIKIGTELANTHSKSTSEYTSQTAKQSTLNAGKGLLIIADGGAPGAAGDIHVIGSSLKAADTVLIAKNNITLESAQNTANWANNNSNNKTAIGASFNLGEQNGFTLDLGASIAKSMGTGSSVTQVNTTLDTGSLSLHSGQDTTLAGAQVRADSINALIDGNLTITSRQDTETQKSKQGSAGFGGSICIPPFCYGSTVAVSGSLAAGNMNSEYKAVTDQSGLFAGTGGYDITVGKNTTLQGAVIASEASADKNLLSTDRLIVSDIKNTSDISAQSAGFSASYGSNAGSSVGGSVPLSLNDSDHSSTRSAVSEGTIIVRNAAGANDLVGLNRDTANANQTLDKPDEKAIQERIDLIQSTVALSKNIINKVANAQQQAASDKAKSATTEKERQAALNDYNSWGVGGDKRIMADVATGLIAVGLGGVGGTTAIGIVANTTSSDTFKKIGDYADKQAHDATDSATRAAWAEGGAARVMLHALAGAAMGLSSGSAASGALGAGISAALMPTIADALRNSGLTNAQQNDLGTLIASGLGAMAGSGGGTSGAITAVNSAAGVDMFNRQLHKHQEIPLLKKKAEELEKTQGQPESSARWEDLLLIASGAEVDAVDLARLTSIMKQAIGNDPESAAFVRDMGVAYEAVAQLSAQKIPLTWSDGRQIVANGAPVYAFNATKEQFNDSTLFNAAGTYGPGAVYEQWRQFGPTQTSQYSNELSNISTYDSGVADAAERLSALAGKGVLSVSIIDDAILSLTGLRSGKVVVDAVLEVLTKREAAKKAAADGAKAIDDSAAYTKWWDNVAQPKNLTDREARAWYLSKEAEIPSRIDTGLPLEDQAKQAFAMRNDLRSTARELMSNRNLADSLNKSDPNRTWSEIVNKYSSQGLSEDGLWRKIIEKSQSSRTSVNDGLGM